MRKTGSENESENDHFAKVREGFDFSKMIIFQFIFNSFQSSFLKNGRKMKTENEPKMARKWLL